MRDLQDRCLIWAMPSAETTASFGKLVPIPHDAVSAERTFHLYQWTTAAASPPPQKPLLCSPRARAQEPCETYQRKTERCCRSVRWHVACRHTLPETGFRLDTSNPSSPCCQGHRFTQSGSYDCVRKRRKETFKLELLREQLISAAHLLKQVPKWNGSVSQEISKTHTE